jgi:hypothetical protein
MVASDTAAAPSATSPSVRIPIGFLERSRLMPSAMPEATAAESRIAMSARVQSMGHAPGWIATAHARPPGARDVRLRVVAVGVGGQ